MKGILNFFKKIEPDKQKSPLLHTAFEAFFTFVFTPNHTTKPGTVHLRDAMDLKRTMTFVVLALQLCYVFGTYNIGYQHFAAMGMYTGIWEGLHLKLVYGLIQLVPIFVVSMVVGLGIEFYFSAKRGHSVEEGYLVTGALIPLIMPPDIPLWILSLSIIFAVILGKEAFGGTGMNVVNIALLSRVFIFFAYPGTISGDSVWVSGFPSLAAGTPVEYGWFHESVCNPIFEAFGWTTFDSAGKVIDGFTGATPLSLAAVNGWAEVAKVYSPEQMWWGLIPGSIGETGKPLIILGAIFLIITGIGSWRIMLAMALGAAVTALLFNAWGFNAFMQMPWYYHFYIGSLLFAMTFMATDPVTAASTNIGKWFYGFFIGVLGVIIRVLNPAYPEGWMLAILFLNVCAPLIDHFVIQSNIKKRLKYVQQ
jgi:Na+-transporting NADH:ubiquinone oxidoreductase subunit B